MDKPLKRARAYGPEEVLLRGSRDRKYLVRKDDVTDVEIELPDDRIYPYEKLSSEKTGSFGKICKRVVMLEDFYGYVFGHDVTMPGITIDRYGNAKIFTDMGEGAVDTFSWHTLKSIIREAEKRGVEVEGIVNFKGIFPLFADKPHLTWSSYHECNDPEWVSLVEAHKI